MTELWAVDVLFIFTTSPSLAGNAGLLVVTMWAAYMGRWGEGCRQGWGKQQDAYDLEV